MDKRIRISQIERRGSNVLKDASFHVHHCATMRMASLGSSSSRIIRIDIPAEARKDWDNFSRMGLIWRGAKHCFRLFGASLIAYFRYVDRCINILYFFATKTGSRVCHYIDKTPLMPIASSCSIDIYVECHGGSRHFTVPMHQFRTNTYMHLTYVAPSLVNQFKSFYDCVDVFQF